MNKLDAYKMDGLGNDFIIFDKRKKSISLTKDQIIKISDRNNIGCDQVIFVNADNSNNAYLTFYNSDGNEIKACGNGSRCAAYLLMKENNMKKISLKTKAGILQAELDNKNLVSINMGQPNFEWKKIPLSKEMDNKNLKIKINAVALKGINDNEILNLVNWCGENKFSLTFIEVMPMGEIGEKRSDQYMPLTDVKSLIQTKYSITEDSLRTGGPARYVHCHETDQKIGFITPHTHNFCELCNRVRITCTGEMYMCLGQQDKADLKSPLRKSENDQLLKDVIYEAILRKPKGHDFVIERKENEQFVPRHMNVTGG